MEPPSQTRSQESMSFDSQRSLWLVVLGALLCVSVQATALHSGVAPSLRTHQPPSILVPHTTVTPSVDGSANDPAWNTSACVPALSLSVGPQSDGLTALPTQVQVLWDEKYLYFRFTCRGDDAQSPYTHRDDPLYKADAIEMFLDPKGDAREWVEVEASPNNVIFDKLFLLTADPVSGRDGVLVAPIRQRDLWTDVAWNLDGLRTSVRKVRNADGTTTWIADLAVPADPLLRRLGASQFSPMTLRGNLVRYHWFGSTSQQKLLAMNWASVAFGYPHVSPQAMGSLVLVHGR